MANLGALQIVRLLTLITNTVLLSLLIIQAVVSGFFLVAGHLPMPPRWCERIINIILLPELVISVNEVKLQPGGLLQIRGADLKIKNTEQNIARAASIFVKINWNLGCKAPTVNNITLIDGRVLNTFNASNNNQQEPLLKNIALRIVPNQTAWKVDHFTAQHGNVYLRGKFQIPFRKDSHNKNTLSQKIETAHAQATRIIQKNKEFEYIESATIDFEIHELGANKKEIDLHVYCNMLRHPKLLAEKVEIKSCVELLGVKPAAIKATRLKAKYFELPDYKLGLSHILLEIPPERFETLVKGNCSYLNLSAKSIKVNESTFDATFITFAPIKYPEFSFYGVSSSLSEAINFNGQINTMLSNGHLEAHGGINLITFTPQKLRKKIPKIIYKEYPYCHIELDFTSGFTVKSATVKANINEIQVEGLNFDRITAHASYKNGIFTIENLNLRKQQQSLDCSFIFDSNNYNYRSKLIGRIIPNQYNALLPRWWTSIFKDFDFEQTQYCFGNFVVYGNAQNKFADTVFGYAEARKFSYKDVFVDSGNLTVQGLSGYTELNDLKAICNQGWITGNIAFTYKADQIREPVSMRLDLTSMLRLNEIAKLSPKNISPIVAEFEAQVRPLIKISGAIFNKQYPEHDGKGYIDLHVNCSKPVNFKNINLDHLNFYLYGRNDITNLRKVNFGYAQGEGHAKIDILEQSGKDNNLIYLLSLEDARRSDAINNIPQINRVADSLNVQKSNFIDEASAGRVALSIHGSGPYKNPMKHMGFGNLSVIDDQLASIQLLGPLSKILQDTPLSFTTLGLSSMKANFSYKDEDVYFDSLLLDGPLTRIQSSGIYKLIDQSLDMRVSVSLLANVGKSESQFLRLGSMIYKSLPKTIELELSGTLKNQKFRHIYDPRKLIPKL